MASMLVLLQLFTMVASQNQSPAAQTGTFQTNGFSQPIMNPAQQFGETTSVAPQAANPVSAFAQVVSPMMAGAAASQGPFSGGTLSRESMDVVSGLVEAFMHKVQLQPGERQCLESNIRQLSGDVMGTVGDIVTAVKALIAGNGAVKKNAMGGVVSAGMDTAMKITGLVTSSMQLIKSCVHGDAMDFMNITAQHLINGTYLEKRFIVNGVDIAHSLSDSVVAFEAHDFHRFGTDIGIALRKILLSNANNANATALPEGMPQTEIIREATDGLFEGFFAAGSVIEITDKAHPDVDIVVDLHQCIAGNSMFFKELWLAAWNLIAKLSVNGHQHGLGNVMKGRHGQPKWEGELMIAMMQFPSALANCGVAQDIQTMFMEAINSLDQVNVHVQFPHDHFGPTTATDEMAKAVEAWTNFNFKSFGYELGTLLRELVVLAMPQKYSMDASGRLRRFSQPQNAGTEAASKTVSSASFIVGGAAFLMIVAFAVVRARRSSRPTCTEGASLITDVEECASNDAIE